MTDVDLSPEDFAADKTLIPEQPLVETDWSQPGLAGALLDPQSGDFTVIDPDTGEDTDDQADPDAGDANTTATDGAGD